MDYRFYLDDTEIDEPIGWSDFELSMNRDDTYHGIQFEVSTGALRFFGTAANYLQTQKEANGIFANVTFTAQETCDAEYETVITGRLNFGKYKDTCGNSCIVEIPFEEEGCKVIFKNRFDQKVDIDKIIAHDNMTLLPAYTQLGQEMQVPAKALQSAVDGSVAADGYSAQFEFAGTGGVTLYLRPDYEIERYNNIATGQLVGGNNCVATGSVTNCDGPITPQLLFEDIVECFDGNYTYTSRYKGSITISESLNLFHIKHKVFQWDAVGNIFTDGVLVQEVTLFDGLPTPPEGPLTEVFDSTLTGTTTIADGIGFYAVIEVGLAVSDVSTLDLALDTETLFTLEAIKICPATDVQYYMIHETLSRITEAITNRCMRVKSSYYGRIDSQPFAFPDDGCGGLRMVTGGLKLRRAPNAQFFISAKDLISGLNAIDNIGFDIIPDTEIQGRFVLRIEKIDDFYLDQEIFSADSVALSANAIQEAWHYAKVNVGYRKWEVEKVNGLNEFNSTREYRTNIETINTTLDITSVLVAGSYPIEITRQQSFADSGAADTTYDNEAFIICLQRNAYDFTVEQDKVLNDVNIFDPATIMNFRISPVRNLMRWFKSIVNTYPNINSSTSKLFFNAGTGNFTAAGLLDDATACRLENSTIAENATIGITNFTNQADGTPLFKNETAAFDYPLSLAQYNQIKANPYGYVAYTCGNSATIQKGFIKELKFRPARGMANFTLRKKWGS